MAKNYKGRTYKPGLLPLIHVDIEALDQKAPTAAVVSIGGYVEGRPDLNFYIRIEPKDAMKYGSATVDTLMWHMQFGEEHVKHLGLLSSNKEEASTSPEDVSWVVPGRHTTKHALEEFSLWFRSVKRVYPDLCICVRDLDFDTEILKHKFEQFGMGLPWKYWEPVGHRSSEQMLRQLIMTIHGLDLPAYVDMGWATHNALTDALCQGKYLKLGQEMIVSKEPGILLEQALDAKTMEEILKI